MGYGDRSVLLRSQRGGEDEEEEQDERAGQRRAEVFQCAVSLSAPRVSASVYDDDP